MKIYYINIDNRIQYLKIESNQGPAAARNYGIRFSKADYIAFLDSDDTLKEEALQSYYQSINKENADIVYGDMLSIDLKTKNSNKKQIKKSYEFWIQQQQQCGQQK